MDDLDRLLYQGAAQLPPEAVSLSPEPPKPWKGPMSKICLGLALTTITLNFLHLDFILPAIGTVLLWLGFRSLRNENSSFRLSFVCATLYMVFRFAAMMAAATPLNQWLSEQINLEWNTLSGSVPFHTVVQLGIGQILLTLVAAGLWRGLKEVFRGADQEPKTASAGAVAIFIFLLFPMACIGFSGWLVVGVPLVLYLCLLWNLYKLSQSLDEAGYALRTAPVRVSDGKAAACWLLVLAAGIVILPFGYARLPVPAVTPEDRTMDSQNALREKLLELGYPEELLGELSDSDVARFAGAYAVTVMGWPEPIEEAPAGLPQVSLIEVPVSDDRYGFRMVYLARLVWEDVGERPYYTEGIQIYPDLHDTFVHIDDLEGRLDWREGGASHTAKLDLWKYSWMDYQADFSLPAHPDGGQVIGYVFWSGAPSTPGIWTRFNAAINCAHRNSPWMYPYALPSEGAYKKTMMDEIAPVWDTFHNLFLCNAAQEGEYRGRTG